jgi:hypothetical protein
MLKRFLICAAPAMLSVFILAAGCATEPPVKSALAPLPETVTSFGAVTKDGWVYAFGGHKGERHDYSVEMVSGSFERLRLSDGRAWEKLPTSAPGQGLAIVAWGNSIYRVGGMAARNHQGAKQDLYSLPIVQRFDLDRRSWNNAPSLPMPRSSHDATVIGAKLYVAGGWELVGGTNKPFWPSNGLVLDLAHPQSGWKTFPQPFKRRALAVAALNARLYCIGGMDSDNKPTLAVDIYDTASGTWTKGPSLPDGEEIKGFGCSAITQDSRVYVTTLAGSLWRLSLDGQTWETVGQLEHPRIAHRLVQAGKTQLVVLGGEDGEENKLPGLEWLTPSKTPLPAKVISAKTQTVTEAHR